jgi:hypothetical protein
MSGVEKAVRQSVSLPPTLARRVKSLAKKSRVSANRVLVDLIEAGLDAREQNKKLFFELADRLARADDAAEREGIKRALARMTFGD